MSTLRVKNITLQPGRPKVAVPIIGKTPYEIVEECKFAKTLPCDILEWRADYYLSTFENLEEHLRSKEAYLEVMKLLDDISLIAGDMPVIFTVRRKKEGGMVDITGEQADSIYTLVAQLNKVDFIDIELFSEDDTVDEMALKSHIDVINGYGCRVILSYHDFNRMPSPAEIANIVGLMKNMGADICKIAAMTYSKEDVENILKTSVALTRKGMGPLIMAAMGELGKTARVAAGRYGSCITFACGKAQSAPGQVDTITMKKWLDDYYG